MSTMKINLTDNSQETIQAKDQAIEKILTALGIHLEGEAKDELENNPRRVDTGRLKGSITFATAKEHSAGQPPSTAADYAIKGTPEKEKVYIGTNVEYAPYVHEGTTRMAPNRFLKNAMVRNQDQIKEYVINGLKNA